MQVLIEVRLDVFSHMNSPKRWEDQASGQFSFLARVLRRLFGSAVLERCCCIFCLHSHERLISIFLEK